MQVYVSYNYPSVRLIVPEKKKNDITCKPVLNRPFCDEINKSALSRVPYVTYFIPCSKKADFALRSQNF